MMPDYQNKTKNDAVLYHSIRKQYCDSQLLGPDATNIGTSRIARHGRVEGGCCAIAQRTIFIVPVF